MLEPALAAEWAYTVAYDSEEARAATYQDWVHAYNRHRPYTGIGGLTPQPVFVTHGQLHLEAQFCGDRVRGTSLPQGSVGTSVSGGAVRMA